MPRMIVNSTKPMKRFVRLFNPKREVTAVANKMPMEATIGIATGLCQRNSPAFLFSEVGRSLKTTPIASVRKAYPIIVIAIVTDPKVRDNSPTRNNI